MTTPSSQTNEGKDVGIDLGQFHEVFFEEASEHLATMESLLLAIDEMAPSDDDLNAIFRAAHSIKGGAAMFGFRDVTELTHDLESVLDLVRKHELGLTSEMVEAFLQAGDMTTKQLARHRSGEGALERDEEAESLRSRLQAFKAIRTGSTGGAAAPSAPAVKNAPAAPANVAPQPAPANVDPAEQSYARVVAAVTNGKADAPATDDDVRTLAQHVASASSAPAASPAPAPELEGDGFGFFVDPAEVKAGGAAADTSAAATAPALPAPVEPAPAASSEPTKTRAAASNAKPAAGGESTSIRVSIEKVDQLINMVGELVITQAMLTQRAEALDPVAYQEFVTAISDLQRNSRALQEAVMSIRMLPISTVFSRYPRMVRDLAAKLGKKIELKMVGEGTELDKGLIEKIVDPLTHLVRNSLDHGVESPDKRLAAGKPATGTVTLSAYHQGGAVVIDVADDGAGLNRERILAKAKERGMAVPDTISDAEVWNLIFEAGFSTAAVVTDVSGRGVGMDVVKRNIGALNGSIEIQSNLGKGSRITVRLPLTLAIMDGMSVSVAGEIYIIPLSSIIESLQVKDMAVKTIANAGRVVQVRGEYLPLIVLGDLLGIAKSEDVTRLMMVIVEVNGTKTAIIVDELVGQQQVVVKSIEANYKKIPGISGATIMGDGRVAFILDMQGVVRLALH